MIDWLIDYDTTHLKYRVNKSHDLAARHTHRKDFDTNDTAPTHRGTVCSPDSIGLVFLLGTQLDFLEFQHVLKFQKSNAFYQAKQVLEDAVRVRAFSHLKSISTLCCLAGSRPPRWHCSFVDVDRYQALPSTSNCSFGSKCLNTNALGLWANLLVSHVTCSSTEQTSSMCFSCLFLLMAPSHRHRSLQNHASMDQLKKCLIILFSHDIIRILFFASSFYVHLLYLFFMLCTPSAV